MVGRVADDVTSTTKEQHMALLDEALAAGRGELSPCDLQRALDGNTELAVEIVELVSSPQHQVRHTVVERVLAKRGISLRAHTVARHRANECQWCASQDRVFG